MPAPKTLMKSGILALGSLAMAAVLTHGVTPANAAPGDHIATVTLPGSGGSVGGTTVPGGPDGIVYVTPDGFSDDTWQIFDPPAGTGNATLLSTKNLVDSDTGAPVVVTCGTWDPTRNVLWVANAGVPGPVYSVDLGDLNVSGDAVATHEFDSNVGGITTCDGLAYDPTRDTLWISPDIDTSVYEYDLGGGIAGFGVQIREVSPKDEDGNIDGLVSGVTIGSDNTLYIARNGAREIRRVDKDTGDFVSNFTTTEARSEDLSCDPITYAPLEAIIAQELVTPDRYEAFEVEPGTCPLPGRLEIMIDIKFLSNPNAFNCRQRGVLPVVVFGMEGFDVTEVDLDSLQLDTESGSGAPVDALRASLADVGDPEIDKGVSADEGNPDGILDIEVKFDAQEVAELIGCDELERNDISETLVVKGLFLDGDEWQSTPEGDVGIDQLVIKQN